MTKAERRELIRGLLDQMVCDVDAGYLTALRPKPAFGPLLRQVGGLKEREGVFEIEEGTNGPASCT